MAIVQAFKSMREAAAYAQEHRPETVLVSVRGRCYELCDNGVHVAAKLHERADQTLVARIRAPIPRKDRR